MRALKRRLNHKNPNVQLLALGLTDVCIKNGGDPFLVEVASREFMDNLVSILKMPGLNRDVKSKSLRLIQNWSIAFEGKPNLSYTGEVYKTLQREGFNFPPRDPAVTSAAMVDTQTAPEWIDSDVCLRCRTPFSFTNRKHHCRNCGQVFDQQCSSKSMPLPHFGITQEVRVCDSCHSKLTKKNNSHRPAQSAPSSRHRSTREAADADLQRAIQLSLQEVGAAGGHRPGYIPSPSSWQVSEPPIVDRTPAPASDDDDPELRAAIEASLREANAPKPSAPMGVETPRVESTAYSWNYAPGYPQSYPESSTTPKPSVPSLPNYDLEPLESDAILTFSQTLDQVQAQGGRDLSRYPAVTELFDRANALRPKLAMGLSDTGRKEELLTEMHEKLSQAVKLYDKLLTEQLSQPRWRAVPPAASPNVQSGPSGYSAPYQPAPNSYGQWAGPSQATSPHAQSSPPHPYFTPQAPANVSQPYPSQSYQQSSSNTAQTAQPPPQQFFAPPPTAPASIPQYSTPLAPPTTAQSPPPPPIQQPTSSPIHLPPASSPPQSVLARHNTIAMHPAPPPPPPAQQRLPARANTTHAPQQLHQLQQTSVPVQLPNFPPAPMNTLYQYGPPIPEPERKEALLIDL